MKSINDQVISKLILCFVFVLTLLSCGTKPPLEKGDFIATDLVELITLDSSFQLDIRYASSNNFVGKPVYKEARAFLQRPAALALVEASKELKKHGYGVKIFDGYRPWSVTKTFWDITPKEQRNFVADPSEGSRHNRGCAIDLTLYELSTGEEVIMPSEYDEFNERAYPYYEGGTDEQRKMRDLLRSVMEAHDFKVYEYEWWHFDYKDWRKYRIQNIPFSNIKTN
ncbi:M15 family metallopeptidase [Arenibacter sp. ARW7G5Y1]|uniref:M15 family metallopeptidase n=1 Tax=Arenibacter sp. ARW7G5Y1 TaxID=2135619 RepID=UPI000D75BC1A|nr:M15 family metallopeptidase [Arenibacter sp. ARW7G5Y1]PXX30521.1 D-alanyl-D-alanine dipeptidase [Arenibacter sp. ARW7G5Y1]|tara:strand:- start:14153 stop:14827 length:675 start_codon:yes stop_codon:yes gene_type:complete